MKKYILSILFLAIQTSVYAERVEISDAKTIAIDFLNSTSEEMHQRSRARGKTNTDYLYLAYTQNDSIGEPMLYVFNKGFDDGFIIVSADDCAYPVLGYSDTGYFDIDSISDVTKGWLDDYAQQISHGISKNAPRHAPVSQAATHQLIVPMTKSRWNQGTPYNNDCPTYDGVNHCPAGCVPVAVGQLMYYYKWPKITSDNYVIEWDRLLADYQGASSSSSRAEIAKLLRHIGAKSGTKYEEDGSSTSSLQALDAMVSCYKYNPNCTYKAKSSYSDVDWDNLIYSELSQRRPVLYSANSPTAGHEFIIDGYENGYYHVNWGWGGYSDGYFLLSALLDYNINGWAYINIYPDGDYSLDDSYVKWGYCNDYLVELSGSENKTGGGIIIPKKELLPYIGKKVIGMEVGLVGDVKDMECFISPDIDSNIMCSQWFEYGYGGWNRVMFDYPFTIDGEQIFAAYTFTQLVDDVAIASSTRIDTQKMYGTYASYTFDGSKWTAGAESHIAIRLLLEGEGLPIDVRLTEVDDVIIEKGESLYLTGTIENMSNTTIRNCTFMYSIEHSEPKEYTVTFSLEPNRIGQFSIPTNQQYQDGYYDINVWITKVNGKEDAVKSNNEYWKTHSAQLKVRGQKFKRRMVVEESTGTWCGWCPRGIVALERMKEEYPDDFIGIAIHDGNSDVMSGADNYRTLDSYPSGLINRVTETGMSYSTLRSQLSKYSGYADVDIDAKANYTVKEAGCLEVNTNLTWGTINPNHTYQLAIVVLEDNVGPYAQYNGGYTDGSLADLGWPYTDLYVSTLFNDVARGIYDTYNGIPGSIAGDLLPNVRYKYNNFLTLPSTVANKDNVNIVCMVIDVNTGEIMNAVKTSIMDYSGSDNLVISHNHIEIDNIEARQLSASIMRDEYRDMTLQWGTMDGTVAIVDQKGKVKGVSEGTTSVYVQIKDMPMTRKECIVTVTAVPNIFVDVAGTLDKKLGNKKYEYSKLKISGEINGNDLDVLAQMMGCDNDNITLTHLDLTEARIVKGGEYQYNNSYYPLNEDDCLPNFMFTYSKSLKYISMPSTLKNIGHFVLSCSNSIEEIILNEGLETIDYNTLGWNITLKKINIPSTLQTISTDFLYGCKNVIVTFDNRNPYLGCDGKAIYSTGYKTLLTMIPSSQGTYTVNENCVSIRTLANGLLTGLIAPNVREVSSYAFYFDDSLSFLAFGSPLSTIGYYGLCNSEKLRCIYLGCKTVPGGAYRDSKWDNISNCTLYVPNSSIDAYKADPFWGKMKAIKAIEGTEFEYLMNPEISNIETVECGYQDAEEIYTLDGRKVSNPTKGLYIINGQKVAR